MFRKLLLTCVLGIGMLALTAADASAGFPKPANWNLVIGSVCLDSTWTGLGKCEGCFEIQVTLDIYSGACSCLNPGGQDGGIGNPFTGDVTVVGEDAIGSDNIVARGRTYSSICWEDDEITDVIMPYATEESCSSHGNGWTLNPDGYCVIRGTDVLIKGCGYDKDGDWVYMHEIWGYCDWNDDTQVYVCTEDGRVALPPKTTCPWAAP